MGRRKRELNRQFDRVEQKLPRTGKAWAQWLRKPRLTWVRIGAGILLIVGGLLSFLPVLGLWMLPAGLTLIALDVPFLRKPMARLIAGGLEKWEAWQGGAGAQRRS